MGFLLLLVFLLLASVIAGLGSRVIVSLLFTSLTSLLSMVDDSLESVRINVGLLKLLERRFTRLRCSASEADSSGDTGVRVLGILTSGR